MDQKAILDGDPITGNIVTEVRREQRSLKTWQAYVFAMVATVATLGLRLALAGQLGERPTLIVFTVPIMLSAYVGGLRSGLLATGLSYLGASYYLLPPFNSFLIASSIDRWDMFFLMLAGVVISALNEALHRARHRADVAIRERAQEDRRRFFALSQDVLCTLGFDGYFQDLNPAWEKTLGYTKVELLTTPFIEFVHPDDRDATLAEAEKVASGKALIAFENRYRCKDGSYRRFQWSVTPVIYMPLQPRRPLNKAKQMNIEVTTLEPQRVAYMRHVGPYNGAYRVWLDLTTRLKKDGLPRKDSLFIGVPMDNPKVTPPEKLRYDACVTMDEKYVPTKPVRVRTIAGGDYVVARNCPIGAIARGYEKLFYSWLPKSGRKVRKAPSFLVRVNGPGGMPPTFGFTDIYVPLEVGK